MGVLVTEGFIYEFANLFKSLLLRINLIHSCIN